MDEFPDISEWIGMRYDDTVLSINQSNGAIKEMYGYKGQVFELEFGQWNYLNKSLTAPKHSKWERRTNMQGAKIRTAILHWYPVSVNITQPGSLEPSWTGFMVDILETLQTRLNFTIEFNSPQDRIWGKKVVMAYTFLFFKRTFC